MLRNASLCGIVTPIFIASHNKTCQHSCGEAGIKEIPNGSECARLANQSATELLSRYT